MLKTQLADIQERIVLQLEKKLDALKIADEHLAKSMHYGVLNGGKRLRPFLVYATAQAFGASLEKADSAAVAMEMIHSYSLVHDDLPYIVYDVGLRRRSTSYIIYGESNSIKVCP